MTEANVTPTIDPADAAFEKLKSLDAAKQEVWCKYIGEKHGAAVEAEVRQRLARDAKPEPVPEPAEPEPSPAPSRALVVAQEILPSVRQDPTIAAMNENHAIIDNVGGKTVIACWEPSPLDTKKLVVTFHNKDSFLLRYSNRHVTIDVGGGRSASVPLGQYWLSHRNRRNIAALPSYLRGQS
jgi:hypothetical protein